MAQESKSFKVFAWLIVGVIAAASYGAWISNQADNPPRNDRRTTDEIMADIRATPPFTPRTPTPTVDPAPRQYLSMLERSGGFDTSSANEFTLLEMGYLVCDGVDEAVSRGQDLRAFMAEWTEPMSRAQGMQFVKAVTAATLYLCPWNEDWK